MRTLAIESYILGRSGDIILVNKPWDWPTSGHTLDDPECIQFHLIRHFGQMVWTLHQLDADTSGTCLFSLNRKLVGAIQRLWNAPGMEKNYLALVHGEPEWDQIDCRAPIGMVDSVSLGVHPEGKLAHSRFQVLSRKNGYSSIHVRIFTGRTHQIRIHLSHLGHPLIGEEWYRDTPCSLHHRQALHALKVSFPPNGILSETTFSAPVSADLCHLAESLGLSVHGIAPETH